MSASILPSNYAVTAGIREREEHGLVVLAPTQGVPRRRILFVNSYGGRSVWERIKQGVLAPHHLWGCLELVRMGYEVALAEPLAHFYLYRRPFPHDLRLLKVVKNWLKPGDIIFCGHTLLYWLPLLKMLGGLRRPIVSLTYAREELDFARAHTGIAALTPAAVDQAKKLAPNCKVAYVGWGVDVDFYPQLPYQPEWLLSCGIANRDFGTLCRAATLSKHSLKVIYPGLQQDLKWPGNAAIIDGGSGWHTDNKKQIDVQDLLRAFYPRASASMVIMNSDPTEYTANGFTNMMEGMAIGRPLIITRTGALPGELDVEKAGCGLHVPPEDPRALAQAMDKIASDPELGRAMGEAGRRLCESRYNLGAMASRLHAFFESM